jgi:cyclophilin family peptidyl-prolyl cis-trans isomerase
MPKPAPVGESGKGMTYRNSPIHRVVGGFVVQGGDFVFGNGSGGESIYGGRKFKDERAGLGLRHDGAGVLSMGNSGKNSNTSQFFVTLGPASHCDGRHVVFGEVVSGMDVLRHVEGLAATDGGGGDPAVPVGVTDCGAFVPLFTSGAGSWYDRPDAGSYSGTTPEFVVRPRVGILAPNGQVAERFREALGAHASTTILVAAEDVAGGEEEVARSALGQLGRFALDVIVAAPACARLMRSMDVPPSWHDAAKRINGSSIVPNRGSVFIEAKPVDVIDALMSRSWVGTMRPGWLLSASFA